MTIIDKDWLAALRRDRVGFARELASEMTRTAAHLQALATLAEFYFDECAKSPSSPGPASSAEAEARPGLSADAGKPGPERIGVQVDEESSAEAGEAGQPAPIPARADTQSDAGTSGAESPGAQVKAVVPPPPPRPTLPETSTQPDGPLEPTPVESTPPASADAKASDSSDVGAAPAGIAERPPQPITPEIEVRPTMKEQVLRLWANSEKTADQIAKEVGCSKASVHTYLYEGRRTGDERALARSAPAHRQKPAVHVPEKGPTIAGIARAMSAKPVFDPPAPAPIGKPHREIGVIVDVVGKVFSLDMTNFVIVAAGGDWKASRPVAKIMERLRNGDLLDHRTLADVGNISLDSLNMSISLWKRHLEAIGLELVAMKGVGCRVRVLGQ